MLRLAVNISSRKPGRRPRHRSCLSEASSRWYPQSHQPPCRREQAVLGGRSVYHRPARIFRNNRATSSHVSIHRRLHSNMRHIALVQSYFCCTHRRYRSVENVVVRSLSLLALRKHSRCEIDPLTMSCVAHLVSRIVPYRHRQDACYAR
jgi:hypothetical protein